MRGSCATDARSLADHMPFLFEERVGIFCLFFFLLLPLFPPRGARGLLLPLLLPSSASSSSFAFLSFLLEERAAPTFTGERRSTRAARARERRGRRGDAAR